MISPKSFSRRLRYALETLLVYVFYILFRILPLDLASSIGGWIGRGIGPRLTSSDTARRNLAAAFPDKSIEGREKIVIGMWDNLGRMMAEYAHIRHIRDRVELVGGEHFAAARDSGRPSIFFAAHVGNWEVSSAAAKKTGLDMHSVYRRPNNPGVEGILRYARGASAASLIPKGAGGAREMLSVMKKNGALGILVDQKLNEGMPVPFFGRDAMTAPAVALFALKFNCPVYPARTERLEGARFRVTIYPALEKKEDIRAMLTEINRQIEGWIRERPEQWLWIHQRWPD